MVGTVMTGLLLGILLSRTVSGLVGALFGWRVMYQAAALSIAHRPADVAYSAHFAIPQR